MYWFKENPFAQDPKSPERRHRSYKNKVQERTKIFNEMKRLQLGKLNRATYNLLLDVSPMVDQESNVLQHFLSSDLVSLGIQENPEIVKIRSWKINFQFDFFQVYGGT